MEAVKQAFANDSRLRYYEPATGRKCYWDTPYNPEKFKMVDGKLMCTCLLSELELEDMPLMHYFNRDLKFHEVIDITGLFKNCEAPRIVDAEMQRMFESCKELKPLDLSEWAKQPVTD